MSRKEKMKVYHGIPKSVTDKNTVLYDGFDYTSLFDIVGTKRFYDGFTGGTCCISSTKLSCISISDINNEGTIDMWVDLSNISSTGTIVSIQTTDNYNCIALGYNRSASLFYIDLCTQNGYVNAYGVTISNPQSKFHLRVTWKIGSNLDVFVNGKLHDSKPYKKMNGQSAFVVLGGQTRDDNSYQIYCNNMGISDLHISNIYRGDYFPNLPKDFIEGKATIKERLGQQQIKGDPLTSQETSVIVPAYVGDKRKLYQLLSDKSGQLLDNPEITNVWGADSWSNGAYFKIQSLNNEIISGVIDSNTALAKVTAYKDILTVTVDDVSKISVGDKLYVYYPYTNEVDNVGVRVVESVDVATKTVKVTSNYGFNINTTKQDCYLVEITETSSSPIVKTSDGTTVNGTWSGLGTNIAMFMLGSNTGLSGKDLYVTYSLNMPPGNSQFPELPSEIEKAYTETGIEMKPVSEILIEDDFIGKVSGDTKNCPHTIKFHNSPTLIEPTGAWAGELKTDEYSIMASRDNSTIPVLNQLSGHIPQLLLSFNLIEIVERKIGEIPGDKVQWLKDNVDKVTLVHCGYGVCPSGNRINFHIGANYFSSQFAWQGGSTFHTNSVPTVTRYSTLDNYVFNKISRDGFINWLVTTEASNGNTFSIVYTDYVGIEVLLKKDNTFTTLYCDNQRAREDKCNPVLIQKETKTVKRYLPSKECFVTESNYSKPTKTTGTLNDILFKGDFIYLTTLGSGSINTNKDIYKNCLNKLGESLYLEPYKYSNEPIYKSGINVFNKEVLLRFVKILGENTPDNTYGLLSLPLTEKLPCNSIALKPFLSYQNGELILTLWMGKVTETNLVSERIAYYKIPNKPLIK